MQYVRIHTDAEREPHFEDVDVDTTIQRSTVSTSVSELSSLFTAEGVIFRRVVQKTSADTPHCAPRRQFVIHLAGESEVEVSDGEVRRMGPGSVVLVDDTSGNGHITRGDASRRPRP